VRVSPPLVLLAVGFADVGVRLLYSDHFETAIRILRWQLAGDVAKCLSWAYAGPLLYRGRIRAFNITELTAAALLAIAAWVLIELHGSEGVGQAYLITYLAYLPLAAAVTSLSLGVTARLRHLVVVVSSTVAMAMLAAVEINIYARVAISVVVCIWLWCAGLLSLVFRKIRASIS
jgi:O-antigen/teichoic acid export membrane protein